MKIIYNDDVNAYVCNFKKDIIDALNDLEIEINDDNIYNEAQSMIDADSDYLKESLINIDSSNYDKIIVFADLGLWYGRRTAKAIFNTLSEAIQKCCYDSNMLYFNKKNDTLKMTSQHHDGCNKYRFYKLVNGKAKAITIKDFEGFYL